MQCIEGDEESGIYAETELVSNLAAEFLRNELWKHYNHNKTEVQAPPAIGEIVHSFSLKIFEMVNNSQYSILTEDVKHLINTHLRHILNDTMYHKVENAKVLFNTMYSHFSKVQIKAVPILGRYLSILKIIFNDNE